MVRVFHSAPETVGAILTPCHFLADTVTPCCLPNAPAPSPPLLVANPETSLLDIETALRHTDRQAYSVANITEVLAANPETNSLDIETAPRAAAGQAYLVANSTTAGFQMVLGMPPWHAALADAGLTVEQNWAALARRK